MHTITCTVTIIIILHFLPPIKCTCVCKKVKFIPQGLYLSEGCPTRTFVANDPVLIKNFNNTRPKWLQGHIIKPVLPLSYLVKLIDGCIF